MDSLSFEQLRGRVGNELFGKRMALQSIQVAMRLHGMSGHFYWENLEFMPKALNVLLKATGLYNWANRNAYRFEARLNQARFANLPDVFDGYRILHLSDLHIDFSEQAADAFIENLQSLEFDLCVLTGDYRFLTSGVNDEALAGMAKLMPALQCQDGVVGILGNHDFLEIVPGLEELGIQVLINESLQIKRQDQVIDLIGLDDAHYYECHDLQRAMQNLSSDHFKLLLVHSPEIIAEAETAGVDFYLCGHTHGGQVCLPGGIPLITNARCKRKYSRGTWQYLSMQGYTSCGLGTSGLPVRTFCPPEMTVHQLQSV